ncbi:MAG: transposase [Nitrososphaerota archaeon]|nr:transposase [Nitrososphaerota archaeon]
MKSAFRFRLYPNRRQEQGLLRMIEAGRRLWNDALARRKRRWEEQRLSTSYSQQCRILTAERQADPLLGGLYSQAGQDVLRRLDRAFEAFFEHRARYPRFKGFSESGSFTYPQAYNGSVKPDVPRKRLFLSKAGNVKAVFHRPLPRDSRLKTCTVTRESDGEWYASLVYDEVVPLQNASLAVMRAPVESPVGIDLGLLSLIATSDGEKVEHPKFLRAAEKTLKRLQRSLSRRKKGSNNWFKARQRVASRHAGVRRQRADLNHKLSTLLVRSHSLIAFEDLKVRNMVRNHALAKSIYDAGWSQLVRFTEYKASRAGKLLVRVQPACSTQECFFCGALNQVPLSIRQFECAGCGKMMDRDINAARIVLKRGLAQVGQGMPELKPVETGPLPVPTAGRASQVEEAGTIRHETGAGSPRPSVVGGCHERRTAETREESDLLTTRPVDAVHLPEERVSDFVLNFAVSNLLHAATWKRASFRAVAAYPLKWLCPTPFS